MSGSGFFIELQKQMGPTVFDGWLNTTIRHLDCFSHAAFAVAFADMFEANHKIYDMPSNPGVCTKYGSVDFLQFLYDARIFLYVPILTTRDLAPCDDASRALPVAEWLYTHFIVQPNDVVLWALSNKYEKVLKMAIQKGWRSEDYKFQIEYFMHCQSQESLDVAYKLKIFNNLDAQILLNDDAIQIHHIKWLFFNVTKAEFGDFLNILLQLTKY